MPDAANRNPVVNLKDLSSITAKGQKQYSIGEAKTDGGTSGSEFVLNVFAAIRNRLDPTVRFVNSCYLSPEQLGQLVVCHRLDPCLSHNLDDWENRAMTVDSTGCSVGFSRRVESSERQEN